ncbi:unnamed protein product [Ectocarpus sp. 13 AM-2016]
MLGGVDGEQRARLRKAQWFLKEEWYEPWPRLFRTRSSGEPREAFCGDSIARQYGPGNPASTNHQPRNVTC